MDYVGYGHYELSVGHHTTEYDHKCSHINYFKDKLVGLSPHLPHIYSVYRLLAFEASTTDLFDFVSLAICQHNGSRIDELKPLFRNNHCVC